MYVDYNYYSNVYRRYHKDEKAEEKPKKKEKPKKVEKKKKVKK